MAAFRQTLSRWAGQPLPAPLYHLPFALFTAALLAYGGGFAAAMLSNFDVLDLAVTTRDDAFYYFQIAWNMAQGRFSTFDGGITQTNGYHPLWLFLITPFYWFLDKESALFAIRALEIMLIAGGVALIAAAARLGRLPWWLLFAALPLLYRKEALFIGMEAAAGLLMLGLLFVGLALFVGNPQRWKWLLAAICFALPWARLEYVAISLAVSVVLCLFEFPRRPPLPGASLTARLRSFHALAPLLGAVAGILVYFAYNGLVFGGIVPVSGATKAAWSQFRWQQEGGYSFADNFAAALQVPVFDWELLAALGVGLGLLPFWWLARRPENRAERRLFAFMLGAFGLAVGHLAMFGYAVLTVHPGLQGGSQWYYVPGYLLMALLVPLHGYAVWGLIRRFVRPRWPRAAKPLQAAVIVAAAAGLLGQTNFAWPQPAPTPPSAKPSPHLMRYAGAVMADRGLPDGSIIGSWAAGALGYFSRFPVVNLDGLVNSYDYFRATRAGPFTDPFAHYAGDNRRSTKPGAKPGAEPTLRLDHYGAAPAMLREFGITHLASSSHITWPEAIFESGWYNPDGSLRVRFKIRPAATDAGPEAAAFAARLRTATGQPDGAPALAVDGRLAQAFAPGCAPEELPVWVYANGADAAGRNAARPFPATAAYHSPAGWCAAARILPEAAPPPAGVEVQRAGEYAAQLRRRQPPAAQSVFYLYFLAGRPGGAPQLLYAKDECGPEDLAHPFFLHLIPRSVSGLPEARRPYGFGNADFRFHLPGGQFGDWCLAAIPLNQDYPISRLRTGQWIAEENRRLWEVEFPLPP